MNKNEYGVTQFDDNVLILVDEKISNENYSDGTLVVLETKDLKDLKVGDIIVSVNGYSINKDNYHELSDKLGTISVRADYESLLNQINEDAESFEHIYILPQIHTLVWGNKSGV